jgi:hypothetical protein
MVPWLDYAASKDEEKPVISDVAYSNVSASGYTISCKVTDNSGVKRVSFPTWTTKNGQDDLAAYFMSTQQGTKSGDRYTFRVNASAHNNETGEYVTHIYAEDWAGNITSLALHSVQVRNDTQLPLITEAEYTEISSEGYTVTCKVTDDWGVASVSFPTWTIHNGQDDLPEEFLKTQLGTKEGNRYTFRVNASDHNNELGTYVTHIYATDCAGNRAFFPLEVVQVIKDEEIPVISDAVISDVTDTGYTVTCKVTDNMGIDSVVFPTWTDANGQDDLPEDFFYHQTGTQEGDTYTFRVRFADHNYETGLYCTHIYATDLGGNRAKVELSIMIDSKITLLTDLNYSLVEGTVLGVEDHTTVGALLSQFENEDLVVLDCQGDEIADTALVGTGTSVNLYQDQQLVDTVTVVVMGDLDGNGIVDTTDYMRLKAALRGNLAVDDALTRAADVDGNGKLGATDFMRIKSYFLGTYNLFG